jgi:hypothetical protein
VKLHELEAEQQQVKVTLQRLQRELAAKKASATSRPIGDRYRELQHQITERTRALTEQLAEEKLQVLCSCCQ